MSEKLGQYHANLFYPGSMLTDWMKWQYWFGKNSNDHDLMANDNLINSLIISMNSLLFSPLLILVFIHMPLFLFFTRRFTEFVLYQEIQNSQLRNAYFSFFKLSNTLFGYSLNILFKFVSAPKFRTELQIIIKITATR